MHQTIKKVNQDYEHMKFNTAIAAMMSLVNEFYKKNQVTRGEFSTLLLLLNPVAPHITEEMWEQNGKVKANILVALDEAQDSAVSKAMEHLVLKPLFEGKNIVKIIYVPGKILNFVVK